MDGTAELLAPDRPQAPAGQARPAKKAKGEKKIVWCPRIWTADFDRNLSPAEQAANFEKLRKYTEAFDKANGTKLWEAIKKTAATE